MKVPSSRELIKPSRLKAGDSVRIVVPASPVKPEFFEKGMSALMALGLQPQYGNVYRKWRYLAGSDEERREELLEALKDQNARAIFFSRGGYGSIRLLVESAHLKRPFSPKILLGCSDITTLHLFFQSLHKWIVFHGPMASGDFAIGKVHMESFQNAVMHDIPYTLRPVEAEVLQDGEATGKLAGGCLTLLHASIGTQWEPDWSDSVLFLEDVGTKPYQIDRMLTHLKIIGKFDGVQAFIFGEMKDCLQVENQGYTLQEVILDVLGELKKPIFFGFPSGHVTGENWTLPLGVDVRVSGNPFQLEILESAVS